MTRRQFEVTVVVPMTRRVWADSEEEAKKEAFLDTDAIKAVGIPVEITVKEVVPVRASE